ncbi:hypothetical protein D3C87_2024440 [compost metagenome]
MTAQLAARVPNRVSRSSSGEKISLTETRLCSLGLARFLACCSCHSRDSGTKKKRYATGISVEIPATINSVFQSGR